VRPSHQRDFPLLPHGSREEHALGTADFRQGKSGWWRWSLARALAHPCDHGLRRLCPRSLAAAVAGEEETARGRPPHLDPPSAGGGPSGPGAAALATLVQAIPARSGGRGTRRGLRLRRSGAAAVLEESGAKTSAAAVALEEMAASSHLRSLPPRRTGDSRPSPSRCYWRLLPSSACLRLLQPSCHMQARNDGTLRGTSPATHLVYSKHMCTTVFDVLSL